MKSAYTQNMKDWLLEQAAGEAIEGVVIAFDPEWEDEEKWLDRGIEIKRAPNNKLLSWEEAQSFVNYDFYCGYGGADCFKTYAWTKSWVIFISEYDGSTRPAKIPRNPVDCEPSFG